MRFKALPRQGKAFHQQFAALPRTHGEGRFRLMAERVPQIVWITDADGRAEFLNQQWRRYTGIEHDPATAAEVAAAAVHPDDVALTMARFDQARAAGTTFEVEHRIRDSHGVYRWFLVRAEPYRSPVTGRITHWFGASVDIDDRKRAEQDLHFLAARQSFQLALSDLIRPLTDPDEVIAVASELLGRSLKAERVFYGEVDAEGDALRPTRDWTDGRLPSLAGQRLVMADFGPEIVATIRAGGTLTVADVTSNAHSAPYAQAYLDNGIRAVLAIPLIKDGRLLAVLSVHSASVHAWTPLEVAMADDMVDRTWLAVENARTLARLRTESERSQSVFDGMTEGFALLSDDWTVLRMNQEGLRIGGRTAAEAIGRNHWEIWPEAVGTEAERRYRRVMQTRVAEAWEYEQRFRDGRTAWIAIGAYPAGEKDLAVLFRDVTARRETEERLREADRRKDEFLAMLAHELRNPLAPIGAAAQLLQMGQLNEARVRHSSEIIGRQVRHMTHLIDDLLDVSRVTRGLVELDKVPLDIRHVVMDAVEQVTPLIQARQHHLPPDSTTVVGDKKRLVQVLANILNNAAKYTPEGGSITLRTDRRDQHIVLEVADNGIGMAPGLTAHAFDLFAQAERSSDRSAGGLGLGLALVKHLVELHDGSVTCSSPGIGQGSTFAVCLPCVEPAAPADPAAASAPPWPGARRLRVMVVDDNVDAAETMGMMLEAVGHDVIIAHRSRDAIEHAARAAPDVFLLDIGLPDMDGNDLARHLRSEPASAGAVLVAVTGYGQDADRARTLAAGFDHHLVKPVDLRTLAALLAEAQPGRAG